MTQLHPTHPTHPNPCYPKACAIQNCLQSSGFDQAKCEHLIDDLYRCCSLFYKQRGNHAEADSCPIPSVVQRRIRRMEAEAKGGDGGSLVQTKRKLDCAPSPSGAAIAPDGDGRETQKADLDLAR
ncbi:Cx9C motif-containing protein 4, mitochondrial [Thecaphora frezii]